MTVQLFSIGHSNVPTERLLALLEQHAIADLCDVRSAPYSRYNPHFNRETLAAALRAAGLRYHYAGDALGGIPSDPALRAADGRADDARIIASPAFQRGLDRLIALGAAHPTAFMCSEADYRHCHRHRLITPALLDRGVDVWHIMADGSLEPGVREPRQLSLF